MDRKRHWAYLISVIKNAMNKIGVVESREQWKQWQNAPIKNQGGKPQSCEDKKMVVKLTILSTGEEWGVKESSQKVMCGHFSPSLQDTPWPVRGHGLYLIETHKVQDVKSTAKSYLNPSVYIKLSNSDASQNSHYRSASQVKGSVSQSCSS